MANGDYQVVFRGELTGEHPEETVRQQLAELFGMPLQRIDALFSGKPVVVKKNVDAATAERFERTFRKAGARCEVRGPGGEPAAAGGAEASRAHASASDRPGTGTGDADAEEARSAAGEAGVRASADGGSIAAAGDPNGTVVALDIPRSFDGLEIDDSGTPLAPTDRPAPPAIDTGELSLADADAGPLDPREPPPPADIDTSGLRLEPGDDAGGG